MVALLAIIAICLFSLPVFATDTVAQNGITGNAPDAQNNLSVPISLPVTSRSNAAERARVGAGRDNPFSPIGVTKPLQSDEKPAIKLPPYKVERDKRDKKLQFVPPPPPGAVSIPGAGITSSTAQEKTDYELPEPPEKPQLADKLRLVGIVGQRAVFVVSDPELRKMNKWPAHLSLSPGEQFETVNVISIGDAMVTIEEDGLRSTKELERIH